MKRGRKEIGIVLLFAVLITVLAFVSFGCASAATMHYVNPGESIQDAVNAADPGDTIVVRDGTYNENITVYKRLTIQSENGSDSTIVRAVEEHIFEVTADNVNITGFTIEGDFTRCGILITDATNCTISNNIVSGNYQGIYLLNSMQTIISDNTAFSNENYGIILTGGSSHNQIIRNNASNSLNLHGIGLLASSDNNTIANNTAKNNGENGIYIKESNNNTLINNNASNNTNYHGIVLSSSNRNDIRDNIANFNHYQGIGLWASRNNTIVNNTAKDNGNNGIYLQESSNNKIIDNNVSNVNYNGKGIFLYASNHNNLTNNRANSNWDYGIYLYSSSHNNLTSNNASNNQRGIYLSSSDSNHLVSNNASNNWYGIYLSSSKSNNLTGNTASSNDFDGIYLYSASDHNSLSGNIANSNDYEGIFLSTSNCNSLSGNTANSNDYYGLYLRFSSNNTLTNNTAKENLRNDLYVYADSDTHCDNIIENNTGSGDRPIRYYNHSVTVSGEDLSELILCNADNSNINDITIKGSAIMKNNGLFIYRTAQSNFTNINSSNNRYGIMLSDSDNNTLTCNTANSNQKYGIYLYHSSNNRIYNSYFDNMNNAYDDYGNNTWNGTQTQGINIIGGSWLGGNYWSDYTGKDTTGDGIGDTLTPYNSSGNITYGGDWLPLTASAFAIVDTGKGTYPSIHGTHRGTITPFYDINVSKLYTYPCPGTGGHTESIELYDDGAPFATGTWDGYAGDWHNVTLTSTVTLFKGHEYRYVIVTGSYPQIIHEHEYKATDGVITCTEFVDVNGKTYNDWIPAIKLF